MKIEGIAGKQWPARVKISPVQVVKKGIGGIFERGPEFVRKKFLERLKDKYIFSCVICHQGVFYNVVGRAKSCFTECQINLVESKAYLAELVEPFQVAYMKTRTVTYDEAPLAFVPIFEIQKFLIPYC